VSACVSACVSGRERVRERGRERERERERVRERGRERERERVRPRTSVHAFDPSVSSRSHARLVSRHEGDAPRPFAPPLGPMTRSSQGLPLLSRCVRADKLPP